MAKKYNPKAIKIAFFFTVNMVASFSYAAGEIELIQLLSRFTSYQADFTQKTMRNAQAVKTIKGKVFLQRPGFFRWEVLEPLHQVIIANPKALWVYDVDLAQATQQSMVANQNNTLARLLSGSNEVIQKDFKVVQYTHTATFSTFTLEPKSKDNAFESVTLIFDHQQLQGLSFINNMGEKNEVTFDKIKLNTSIDSGLFKFTPAPGVDVLTS